MKKRISVLSLLFLGVVASAGSNPASDKTSSAFRQPLSVEIRLVIEKPNADSVEMRAADDGELFHVSKIVLLSERDISNASMVPGGEQSMLDITLTDAGAKKMKQVTAKHLGAKLAFIVNGRLLKAPVVREPIRDGKVEISYLPEGQALELARLIHQRNQ